MFLNHVKNNIIIFIFICLFFINNGVINANIKIFDSLKFIYNKKAESFLSIKWKQLKCRKIKKYINKYNTKKYEKGTPLFFMNKTFKHGYAIKKFSLFKKNKGKNEKSNIKKKEKKKFTEEEIEELRRKAKEKLQPKKESEKTKKDLLKEKKKKKKKNSEKDEENEKDILKEDNSKDIKEDTGNFIRTKEDFDKIVDLTKDLINPKEVEYINKITDCDEELLKYDKREKHIHLNYEDTIFDEGNYMDNYVNNISKFRFDIYNLNNKNEFDRITKYLNYQYIEEINVDFPTDKSYNIELKEYFYQIVCDLISKHKEKFENYVDEEKIEHKESNESNPIYIQKGKSNFLNDKIENNKTVSNFLNENINEEKKLSTLDQIQNMNVYRTEKNIIEKYMTFDLFNLLCEIKEEYDYMFENGGIAHFSFDENRIKNKEKLIFSGKKKRAIAMVFLQQGNNHLIINNRDGYQYLQYQIFNLNKIFSPLLHLCMNRYFNVVARVKGGGLSGQSVAIFHALVKYITYNFSLKIKPFFRSFNFMTVDSRKVERKKYGLKKARKRKQYSKR
ncbi:30S ribosomal protein S9, putative [Plasmodium gallinaceum]|uniref:30S ribosomal protein S9, putative n=1 Tax=Plasmodium gallinaceum TaxID=5849 RepID=A0A1J1GWH0_PLAGA|nr:30S ribosomal protein S9, putative [Plasmodium gallinaceum]CRG95653.1 30S ribosomal protein S9, putative [Plasmodium gallinaceum]